MSGGHFNYGQYQIRDIADEVEQLSLNNEHVFSVETIEKFKEAVIILRKAEIMTHRIDWLVCSDDGEDTFHERWAEDLGKLSSDAKTLAT